MKSITLKLIIAFLCISLVTALVIVITTQRSTDREFNQFLLSSDRNTITDLFTSYYAENQSWQGLTTDSSSIINALKIPPDDKGNLPFTLTDANYEVILAGGMYRPGDILLTIDQNRSLPIKYNGINVGFVDIRSPMPVPEPARDRFIQRMQLSLLIGGSAAILLSLGLGFFFSRFITKPIRELTNAAQEVSNGNLNQRVQIHSRDEIGQLSIVFNDMTDKLNKLIKSQKQMTADIAHELRTPISVILGHAEGIHDGVIPSTPETMEIIREESIRLEHLVNDLRMLALSDAGELDLKQMSQLPKSIIDQTYDHFHYQVQARGISLNKMIADKLPEILVDMDRMTQVFSNLLENAIRNTPTGGEITLRAVQYNDVVELSVEDTGYGIEKEDLEKIFDRLYRTDQSRKKDKGGTGLGLALARMIVEQHGGTIHAESEPGKGTRMVIRLQVVIRNGN